MSSGVPESIQLLQEKGIEVRLVTCQEVSSACAIAEDCEIIKKGDDRQRCCITGDALTQKVGGLVVHEGKEVVGDLQAFKKLMTNVKVIAKCSH